MSHLGDLIVDGGPFSAGQAIGDITWKIADYAEVNALRDELIELRAIKAWRDRQHNCAAARAAALSATQTAQQPPVQGSGTAEAPEGSCDGCARDGRR